MSKSSIIINKTYEWRKFRGLIQDCWYSPIIFNCYINPPLKNLNSDNTWFRAYTDDIVLAVNLKEINNKLLKIQEWWEQF